MFDVRLERDSPFARVELGALKGACPVPTEAKRLPDTNLLVIGD
jgi:hypothetical protein